MLRNALSTAAAGSAAGAYEISRSLRFNSADSAYLSRTPASAGNRKTWTWSGWVKRSGLTAFNTLFQANHSSTPWFVLGFANNDKIEVTQTAGSSASWETTALFRDVSAWYHVVLAVDTTSATSTMAGSATDRFRLYVNGTQYVISGGSVPSQNADLQVNNTVAHTIGGYGTTYSNQYLTEIHFIDGQALTPSSFGETNATSGVWSPIRYAGTYGTNGFYLNFSDNSNTTATTLGKDSSGNGNNWTPNNFSVAAGAGNDSLVDSPTPYGTGNSGEDVRGNFCTLNPLTKGAYVTLSNGNLQTAGNSATDSTDARSTFAFSTGKWYWEFTPTTINSIYPFNGIIQSKNATSPNTGTTNQVGVATDSCAYLASGSKRISNSTTSYGDSYTANDVIGVAVDADNGAIYFSKNGTWQNSGVPTSGASKTGAAFTWTGGSLEFVAAVSEYNTSASNINFGARAFSSTAPSGFKALVTTNLPEPTVLQGDDHFNTVLYTGNGSTQSVTGVGFQPDFVWIKGRSEARSHALFDVLRGATIRLYSDSTVGDQTETTTLTAFNSDGFTVNTSLAVNNSAQTFVSWNWKANGAGVSNTDGSISSTVSVNQTAGISIVTYTGTGSLATVGHGLGVKPAFILTKSRSTTEGWGGYHKSLGASYGIFLELTDAAYAASNYWNNTEPTSTVFTVNVNRTNNGTMVAYCFAEVEGFSKFGSYTGNGSDDGPFIFTGFRPAFIIRKRTDSSVGGLAAWFIQDDKRAPYNQSATTLQANASYGEAGIGPTNYGIDILSNGFKGRSSSAYVNASGGTYIYMAFAENPFKYSLAR